MTHNFTFQAPKESFITIHGENNEPILEITYGGKVIWHAEDQASEAARVFCEQLSIGVEHKAGIKQTRKEWEMGIKKAIIDLLKEDKLTVETLERLFYKEEFHNKLKGDEC